MEEFREIKITVEIKAAALKQYSIGSGNYLSEVVAKSLLENYKNVLLIGSVKATFTDDAK